MALAIQNLLILGLRSWDQGCDSGRTTVGKAPQGLHSELHPPTFPPAFPPSHPKRIPHGVCL